MEELCRQASVEEDPEQLIQLREFAAKQRWTVVAEYVDTVSGSGKKDRPQFRRMVLEASQRKFDLLLFLKLDRLSREGTRKTLVYLTQLDSWGVAWRPFMEPFFDSWHDEGRGSCDYGPAGRTGTNQHFRTNEGGTSPGQESKQTVMTQARPRRFEGREKNCRLKDWVFGPLPRN